ncbi:PD-(D/E)XK nuclease family protein, partial [bacterium]|nr:PD-(D/E)XK nuclease family protein [bacterium]
MAVTVDLKPCDWFDKSTWARGIADLLIIDDENMTAWVADWKTGNNKYPDRDQLRLMSLLVFAHHPHIRKVNSALIFVVKDDMVKAKMEVEEFTPGWQQYRERVAKIEASLANGVWHPKQTPLCGWCPCTGCEHNPKH